VLVLTSLLINCLAASVILHIHNPTRLHASVALYKLTLSTAPVNLQVTEWTPHTMILTWQHPSITNGKLREFVIGVKLLSSQLQRPELKMNSSSSSTGAYSPGRTFGLLFRGFLITHTDIR
jgi:hypothetical protein